MNNEARDKLARMVKSYGAQICNTPKTCEIFLKQQVGDCEELEVLTRALREGVVGRLLKHRTSQPWEALAVELTRDLVATGMKEEEAAWAVESWAMALGKHPNAAPAPEPERDRWEPAKPLTETAPAAQQFTGQLIVAIGGGLGAAAGVFVLLGILLLYDLSSGMPAGAPLPDWMVSQKQQQEIGMIRLIVLIVLMVIAGGCGAAGGFGGWLLAKGEPQLAWKGAIRAFGAAFLGTAFFLKLAGFFGMIGGALIGPFGAAAALAFRGD